MSRSKTPTAAQRTVSLFTGQTDIEGGGFARDGSPAEEPTRLPRLRRLIWHGSFGRWWTEETRGGHVHEVFVVEKVGKEYRAKHRGKNLGTFATVGEAGAACEAV